MEVVGTAVGVISLGIEAVKIIGGFISEVKRAPHEIELWQQNLKDVDDTGSMFARLQTHLDSLGDREVKLHAAKVVLRYERTITELNAIAKRYKSTKPRDTHEQNRSLKSGYKKLKNSVAWVVHGSGEFNELMMMMKICKEDLQEIMNELHLEYSSENHRALQDIKWSLKNEIPQAIDSAHERTSKETLDAIRNYLVPEVCQHLSEQIATEFKEIEYTLHYKGTSNKALEDLTAEPDSRMVKSDNRKRSRHFFSQQTDLLVESPNFTVVRKDESRRTIGQYATSVQNFTCYSVGARLPGLGREIRVQFGLRQSQKLPSPSSFQFFLRRQIPYGSRAFEYCQQGNVSGVLQLLAAGEVTVHDVELDGDTARGEWGRGTLLHVAACGTTPSHRELCDHLIGTYGAKPTDTVTIRMARATTFTPYYKETSAAELVSPFSVPLRIKTWEEPAPNQHSFSNYLELLWRERSKASKAEIKAKLEDYLFENSPNLDDRASDNRIMWRDVDQSPAKLVYDEVVFDCILDYATGDSGMRFLMASVQCSRRSLVSVDRSAQKKKQDIPSNQTEWIDLNKHLPDRLFAFYERKNGRPYACQDLFTIMLATFRVSRNLFHRLVASTDVKITDKSLLDCGAGPADPNETSLVHAQVALEGVADNHASIRGLFSQLWEAWDRVRSSEESTFLDREEKDHYEAEIRYRLKYLVSHGADINFQDERGNTVLHMLFGTPASSAADKWEPKQAPPRRWGVAFLIRQLLDLGADPNIRNVFGFSPFDFATAWGDLPALFELLNNSRCTSHRAGELAKDAQGSLLLHWNADLQQWRDKMRQELQVQEFRGEISKSKHSQKYATFQYSCAQKLLVVSQLGTIDPYDLEKLGIVAGAVDAIGSDAICEGTAHNEQLLANFWMCAQQLQNPTYAAREARSASRMIQRVARGPRSTFLLLSISGFALGTLFVKVWKTIDFARYYGVMEWLFVLVFLVIVCVGFQRVLD